jgi:hypothetical protein
MNFLLHILLPFLTTFGLVPVPPAAKAHFGRMYPMATHVSWDKEADGTYEASFKLNGRQGSATYDAKGAYIESEQELKVNEVPAPVIAQAKKEHPKARFTEYEKITRANNTTVYEIEVREGGKTKDLLYTEEGLVTQ